MSNLNNHLKENETKFMIGEELTYVDCVLLPRLQHVRVAGSVRFLFTIFFLKKKCHFIFFK